MILVRLVHPPPYPPFIMPSCCSPEQLRSTPLIEVRISGRKGNDLSLVGGGDTGNATGLHEPASACKQFWGLQRIIASLFSTRNFLWSCSGKDASSIYTLLRFTDGNKDMTERNEKESFFLIFFYLYLKCTLFKEERNVLRLCLTSFYIPMCQKTRIIDITHGRIRWLKAVLVYLSDYLLFCSS